MFIEIFLHGFFNKSHHNRFLTLFNLRYTLIYVIRENKVLGKQVLNNVEPFNLLTPQFLNLLILNKKKSILK